MSTSMPTNDTSTTTNTITNTTNTNYVQSISKGADAAQLVNAIGGQLNAGFSKVVAAQEASTQAAIAAVNTLGAGKVAAANGSELETSSTGDASSVNPTAQVAKSIYAPLLIAAAIFAVVFFVSRKG